MKHLASSKGDRSAFRCELHLALERRKSLIGRNETDAFRVFGGAADGMDGVFVDAYGPGAVLIIHEGQCRQSMDALETASEALEVLRSIGVHGVYLKTFPRDRSRMGGEPPTGVTEAVPAAGDVLPEAILIREAGLKLEVRLYDGLSTGLFLDQRENRRFISDWVTRRVQRTAETPTVLNTFAYTCSFSVASAMGGAVTTSVDVSGRYLDWGKRNFAHNGIDAGLHRFAKMDTFEFFAYARRKSLRYDLMILDPPSFGSGSKSRRIRPWSAVDHFSKLVHEAVHLLKPGGLIFASTNTRELCRAGRLEGEITKGLGARPRWIELPGPAGDFAGEQLEVRAFELKA